jgi:hypothetical protein
MVGWISEQQTGKDVEGHYYGLILDTVQEFAWKD